MAEVEAQRAPEITFKGQCPILRVANLDASIDYYLAMLGFKLNWKTPYFASVERDRAGVFLAQGDQGHPGGWVWIGVSDARALCAEYVSKGAKIRHRPTN